MAKQSLHSDLSSGKATFASKVLALQRRKYKMRKARIGLIGCGGIARHSHLPTIEELAKREATKGQGALDFVAVCDIDENRASEIGGQYGVPYYTDAEEMMEKHKDIDVIDICTGDYTHHSVAKMAAEHKMHPIVEKPMALTLPCCDVMIDACRKNGVHFEVAENYFRMPQDRVIIKLVAEGAIHPPNEFRTGGFFTADNHGFLALTLVHFSSLYGL